MYITQIRRYYVKEKMFLKKGGKNEYPV